MTAAFSARLGVTYVPILDVARRIAAGYQAQWGTESLADEPVLPGGRADHLGDPDDVHRLAPDLQGEVTARGLARALAAMPTLPANTFLSVPVGVSVAASPYVRGVLGGHGSLRGLVLDVTGFSGSTPIGDLEYVLAQYRDAGALIAVGGHRSSQPELSSIVRLRPSILRLGRDWIRDIDRSDSKRTALEVIGQLAAQLDAWILAEGVHTTAELRTLASLAVPLAQGPLIGVAQDFWPNVETGARTALPAETSGPASPDDGVLRALLQHCYTTHDPLAAAAVLPETSGYDLVVVLDGDSRPVSLLEVSATGSWEARDALAVNVATPVGSVVGRAMTRPRASRFTPVTCTDDAGRFLGVLRIERLMSHLAGGADTPDG